jgi:hypothetical protein
MILCFFAQAAWLRNCNATDFSSLKKYPSDFFNPDFIGTKEKKVAYVIAGVRLEGLKTGLSLLMNL